MDKMKDRRGVTGGQGGFEKLHRGHVLWTQRWGRQEGIKEYGIWRAIFLSFQSLAQSLGLAYTHWIE